MAAKTYTPAELCKELGVTSKILRAWLRKEYPRVAEAKNTAWVITTPIAKKARASFAKNKANSAKA